DGQATAVERVEELGLAGLRAPEAQVGAAGLEGLEVRAGRNLLILAARGKPDFQVIGLGRAETQIGRTQRHHAVGQVQSLEDYARVAREGFELVIRLLGQGELHQLDLLELVLADDAARVLAVGAGFAAKARRPRAKLDRQLLSFEHFVAKK